MIELAQIEEALKGVDHASAQSMQWLFCVTALALGCFAIAALRYFMRREERREEKFMEHKDKELSISQERTKAVEEHNRLLKLACDGIEELQKQKDK